MDITGSLKNLVILCFSVVLVSSLHLFLDILAISLLSHIVLHQ